MYMSRYAINEWGTIFLQETYEYDLKAAAAIIGINPIFGVLGTVFSGWLSDKVFKGDRKYPAFTAGVLEAISLYLFLFGNGSHFTLILSMVLFGIAIGVLISFLGGLMAIDLVPRKASGAALGHRRSGLLRRRRLAERSHRPPSGQQHSRGGEQTRRDRDQTRFHLRQLVLARRRRHLLPPPDAQLASQAAGDIKDFVRINIKRRVTRIHFGHSSLLPINVFDTSTL